MSDTVADLAARRQSQATANSAAATMAGLAMSRADEAHAKIDGHEALCAERYAHIHTAIRGVKDTVSTLLKILAWGGTTLFGLLILIIGFLATRSLTSNDAQIEALKHQVEQLQSQSNK